MRRLEKSQSPGIHYLDSLEKAEMVFLELRMPVRTTRVHLLGQLSPQPVLYRDGCRSALPGHGVTQSWRENRPDVSQVPFIVPLFLFLFFSSLYFPQDDLLFILSASLGYCFERWDKNALPNQSQKVDLGSF